MGNRKDIGKLFNERFKDFEQAPGADLWDTIASELDQKNDRRIAPLWLYFGGVLIVGMLTGLLYWAPWSSLSPNTNEVPEIVSTTQASQNEITNTSSSSIERNTSNEKTDTKHTDNTSSTPSKTEAITNQNTSRRF